MTLIKVKTLFVDHQQFGALNEIISFESLFDHFSQVTLYEKGGDIEGEFQ